MSYDIAIENACMDDLKSIQLLFRKMFDIFHEDQDVEYPFSESGERYLKERIEEGFAIVAKHNNCVIGFLTGSIEPALDFKLYENYGFIQNMFIIDEFRDAGIGKSLIDAFKDKCKEQGISYIHTDSDANQSLINFYTGNGFKISGVSYKMKLS